jgi:hypothetical protein
VTYFVCPTCGAPLTLTDPATLGPEPMPYDAPQIATCPDCGRLDRGPLSEKRMRSHLLQNVLGLGTFAGAFWLVTVVVLWYGGNPFVTRWMTLCGVVLSFAGLAVALVVSVANARTLRRATAEWRPYRREGAPPEEAGRLPRAA